MTPQELLGSVISLAVQGKLVPQLEVEGSADALYNHLVNQKQKLIKQGFAKKSKTLSPISEEEKLFEIPNSWRWIKLGEISSVITKGTTPRGGNVSYLDAGIGFLRAENVAGLDKLDKTNLKYIDEGTHLDYLKRSILEAHDILITIAGTLGRTAIVREEDLPLNANQAVSMVRLVDPAAIDLIYLVYSLNSPEIQRYLTKQKKVTAIPNLTLEIIENCLVPLPPLAEQKRIVAKLEEILPLIDRYEAAWNKLEAFNKLFPGDMQKSILQLAIQGKLVEQRPEEGAAVALKAALIQKKQEWVSAGAILKKADTKAFYGDEDLFDIPDTWEWVQLSDVSMIQEGAGIRKWQYRNDGTQILCVTNILDGSVDLDKKRLYISTEEYLEKYTHLTLKKGDIVTSCSGGSWGKIAFFDSDETLMLNTSTLRMRFFDDLADNNYLYYVCKSPFFKRQLELQLSGMQPNFGYAHYSRIVFPLPPLAEQRRIVAKLDEILPLCDRLK